MTVAFVWKISVCWMLFGLVQVKITCFHILLSMTTLSAEWSTANIAQLFCSIVHLLAEKFILCCSSVFSAPNCWLAFFPSFFSSSFSSSARIKWFLIGLVITYVKICLQITVDKDLWLFYFYWITLFYHKEMTENYVLLQLNIRLTAF